MNETAAFQFAEPSWLWLAVLGPLALFSLQRWAARRRREQLASVASPHALAQLTRSHSPARRFAKELLLLLALALTGITLARPQWGETERRDQWLAEDVVFVLDGSRSMLATDVQPNRLQRAKFAIMQFVQRQASGRVGLVAFAGSAFLQCPLTFDYEAFEDALRDLDERTIPVGGTDIGRALNEAVKAMETNRRRKLVILITDGEDLEKSGIKAAAALAKDGAVIYTLGVGTEAGAEIQTLNAAGQMELVHDASGVPVRSRLDEKMLGEIATAGGGRYFPLGRLGEGLARVQQHMQSASAAEGAKVHAEAIDRFQVPLTILVMVLVIESLVGTRRRLHAPRPNLIPAPASSAILLICLCLNRNAAAATNEPAVKTPPPVLKTAKDFYNAGTKLLAKEKLNEAESLFRGALAKQDESIQPRVLYNLGHVRFQQGVAELKKTPDETQVARRIQNAEAKAGDAMTSAAAALAANDEDQMVEAYQRGRSARREIKAAREAVKQALEAYAKTLDRWRRAAADFRSTLELNPADQNAQKNLALVEQAIADLIDRVRRMMQMVMANAPGPKPKFDEMMQKLKGRIPQEKMPPGAPGDDEDEPGGFKIEELKNQMESPGETGEEREQSLSPEEAGQLLNGMKLDGSRRLPMTPDPTGQPGRPRERKLRDW